MNEYKRAIELDEIRRGKEIYTKLYNFYPHSIRKILDHSIYLGVFGINSWALLKEDAITVIKLLFDNEIKIVGIDILIKTNDIYECNYDNWAPECCNQNLDENISQAIRFINEYDSKKKINYFVVVI